MVSLWRQRSWTKRIPYRRPAFALLCTALVSIASRSQTVGDLPIKHNPDSCIADIDTGCIQGTIIDQNRKSLKGVVVEIFPVSKASEPVWMVGKSEWTDAEGRYSTDYLTPGEYQVAVHHTEAPVERRPFATVYYPGVETEEAAEVIVVGPNARAILKPLQVRSLPLATIQIEVMWPDGSRPERSNLLFHNVSFPHQAMIGDESPQIDYGVGEFTAPVGFDYEASADVECDPRILSSSSPVQRLHVGGPATPHKLVFTLAGAPCLLWTPR
jgi:hypothetical protein